MKINGKKSDGSIEAKNVASLTKVTAHLSNRISPENYFYKYSALGGEYPFEKNCITLQSKLNQEFVGFCGAAPVRVKCNNSEQIAFWTCDLFLLEEFRGKGLGHFLYENVERNQPLLLGFGTSDMAYPLKIKRGWLESKAIKEYFYRKKSSSFRHFIIKMVCSFKNIINTERKDSQYSYTLNDALTPLKIEALWQSIKAEYNSIVIRDSHYITWRYLNSPAKECYKYLLVTDPKTQEYKAILIIRETAKILKIVDYIGPVNNIAIKVRLIDEALKTFPNKTLYQCITSCNVLAEALQKSGFYAFYNQPRFTVLMQEQQIKNNADNWFVMLGDSDGEYLEAISSIS